MKRIKKILYIILLFGLFSYLMGSFAAWDFNPKDWSETGRAVGAIFFAIISIVIVVNAYDDYL